MRKDRVKKFIQKRGYSKGLYTREKGCNIVFEIKHESNEEYFFLKVFFFFFFFFTMVFRKKYPLYVIPFQ
jgi:hypothetical protein